MNASRRSVIFPAIVTVVVVCAVVAALIIVGPPSVQRQRNMDEVRVRNLANIALNVNGYVARHRGLPADLDALAKEPGFHIPRADPDTGKPYGYQILGTISYRLCADFTTNSSDAPDSAYPIVDVAWAHGQGHQCFDRNTE